MESRITVSVSPFPTEDENGISAVFLVNVDVASGAAFAVVVLDSNELGAPARWLSYNI